MSHNNRINLTYRNSSLSENEKRPQNVLYIYFSLKNISLAFIAETDEITSALFTRILIQSIRSSTTNN